MNSDSPPVASLGRYRLLRPIAAGGMAEVFLAETTGPRGVVRRCIIKRILPGLAGRAEFADAFIDEARIGATLSHPNLATTLDFDEVDGRLFLVLEYVDGPDLAIFCRALAQAGKPMPIEAACLILTGVLHGLGYAHRATDSQGRPLCIVHRDVNPPNILLSRSGTVKLSDFGIARAALRLSSTRLGHLKGKIPYMSPEQSEGLRLDGRSDLFSCGVVLYEMLTGGRLFGGGDEMEVLRQVRHAAIFPPSAFREGVDHALDRICLKALERDRASRYGSAQEFCADLETLRAKRFPGYGPEELASLIRELASFWEPAKVQREKTPLLGPDLSTLPAKTGPSTAPAPDRKRNRMGFFLAAGAILLLALLVQVVVPQDGEKPKDDARPAVNPALFEILDGHGAYVLVEGHLLGRAPSVFTVGTSKQTQRLEMVGPGMVPVATGTTFSPGKKKTYDAGRRLRTASGFIRFLPPAPEFLSIDGKIVSPGEDGRCEVPAGIHRIAWESGGRRFERLVRTPWEGESILSAEP